MRKFACLAVLLIYVLHLSAQYTPKTEFRGVWIASVANIDYPQAPTRNADFLREEWLFLLDELKNLNFNAVIVQIRPAGDAFYPTAAAPWSAYLTGNQGVAPQPYYDPLEFMIKTAHERNMEFHAWLNPYRATMNLNTAALDPGHQLLQNPDWFVSYAGKYYFDPGLPEVQTHITEVVAEVTEKYDVDAIHFDDYFYPYQINNQIFPDAETYLKHGGDFPTLEAFREDSVTRLIEMISVKIKEIKPHVRFGISPFGVWRNAVDDVRGSDSRAGVRAYDDLHAHILQWLREGTIDYVAPQLYWSIGFSAADYERLLNWWSNWNFGRNVYAGHAIYKINNNADVRWSDANEVPRQIFLNRDTERIQGSAHFSSSKLRLNPLNILQSIGILYEKPALLPASEWLNVPPAAAPKLNKPTGGRQNIYLNWENNATSETPYYYAVYRFDGEEAGDLNDRSNILFVSDFGKPFTEFADENVFTGATYTYVVTAFNRVHNESYPSLPLTVIKKKKKVKVKKKKRR